MAASASRDRDIANITRRRAMSLLGIASAGVAIACGSDNNPTSPTTTTTTTTTTNPTTSAACVLSPELTIGPYFVDEKLNRSDLTTGTADTFVTAAIPLSLAITVVKYTASGCTALQGAMVDVWHAHAGGKYSDEASEGTVGEKYLRGYQISDANGLVTFQTIFPGWYSGRAIHIHVMIRVMSASGSTTFQFTTQLFFDPTVIAEVMTHAPYNTRGTTPDTSNARDSIYAASGSHTLMTLSGGASGYAGAITLGVQVA